MIDLNKTYKTRDGRECEVITDDEIISIAVKTSLLNYIDNETPRRFFVSGHAELEDVVSFGQIIAATAFEKASNVSRAEVERLKARDAEWLDVGTDAHGVITRMKAELTTLRAEVERLRAALKKIAKVTYGSDWTWGSEELADYYSMRFFNAQETARAALGEEEK